jgi:hypothetical protein
MEKKRQGPAERGSLRTRAPTRQRGSRAAGRTSPWPRSSDGCWMVASGGGLRRGVRRWPGCSTRRRESVPRAYSEVVGASRDRVGRKTDEQNDVNGEARRETSPKKKNERKEVKR